MRRLLLRIGAGLVLIAVLLLLLTTGLAHAQTRNCGPREAVVERLATGYGETRQSIGLGSQGSVVEVFASDDTGSWTITVTLPNGTTCLLASGQSYETLREAMPTEGDAL